MRPDGAALRRRADLRSAQAHWCDLLARHLYGPIPPSPDSITIRREKLPRDRCDRVTITCRLGAREIAVDAVFWRPPAGVGTAPLIAGLGFSEPASEGWPIAMLRRAGFGVLLTCYRSWTPDHAEGFRTCGTATLFDAPATGAISLWAWAALRLVDAAAMMPELDATRVVLAGHSRLGKAVLWAGANDQRVAGVFANNAGCAGPSLSRRNFGETLASLQARFPHWTVLESAAAARPDLLPFDQHHLLACLAPRHLYVASGSGDRWADPRGEYLGLRAALPAWKIDNPSISLPDVDAALVAGNALASGAVGWHLRLGPHALTPWDWRHASRFFGERVRD